MSVRIDELATTSQPDASWELPAMKSGATRKITVQQILDLITTNFVEAADVAAVRAFGVSITADAVRMGGYYSRGDGGAGWLYLDAGDASTADDGFLCFVDTQGRRWKRDWKEHGFITPAMAGAIPNVGSDHGAALLKVFDFTGQYQIPLYLISHGETAGGGVCRYFSDRSLPIYTNHRIWGEGNDVIEIRFDHNTNGLYSVATGTTITVGFNISGFRIRGVADTTGLSNQSIGVYLLRCRDFRLDIDMERFAVTLRMDAQSTGFISGIFGGKWFQTFARNPNNGAPNMGTWIKDSGSKKLQIISFLNVKIYGQLIGNKVTGTVPSGLRVSYVIPGSIPLQYGTGIKLSKIESSIKSVDTDFTLRDETNGGDVLIPPSWENPADPSVATPDEPFDVAVVFGPSWAEGDTYEIEYNDPFGNYGMFIEDGSGIIIERGAFGGYKTLFDTDSPDTIISPEYIQLADIGARFRANATNCVFHPLEFNSSIRKFVQIDSGANVSLNPNSGKTTTLDIPASNITGDTEQDITGSTITVSPKYQCGRKIEAHLKFSASASGFSTMLTTFKLYKSFNNGAWEQIDDVDTLIDDTKVSLFAIDRDYAEFFTSTFGSYRYKVALEASRDTADIDIFSPSTSNSYIHVTELDSEI